MAVAVLWAGPALAAADPVSGTLDVPVAQHGHEAALALAKAEDRFVMVYFWTTWCSNCAFFNREVLSDPAVAAALERDFLLVPLDADHEAELAQKYRVRAVPTTIFLDPGGQPGSVLPGAVPADVFLSVLNYVSSLAYVDMEYEDYANLGDRAPGPRPRPAHAGPPPPGGPPVPAGPSWSDLARSAATAAQTAGQAAELALRGLLPGPPSGSRTPGTPGGRPAAGPAETGAAGAAQPDAGAAGAAQPGTGNAGAAKADTGAAGAAKPETGDAGASRAEAVDARPAGTAGPTGEEAPPPAGS
jgi:thioredoxin-related protein